MLLLCLCLHHCDLTFQTNCFNTQCGLLRTLISLTPCSWFDTFFSHFKNRILFKICIFKKVIIQCNTQSRRAYKVKASRAMDTYMYIQFQIKHERVSFSFMHCI
ncbi:hypothetical protein V6Z11_D11G147000 [Gossypium hirsutum]